MHLAMSGALAAAAAVFAVLVSLPGCADAIMFHLEANSRKCLKVSSDKVRSYIHNFLYLAAIKNLQDCVWGA
jgi:hypothetical protein